MSMETNPYESSEAVLGAQERQVRASGAMAGTPAKTSSLPNSPHINEKYGYRSNQA
jgi:hypothetical protein